MKPNGILVIGMIDRDSIRGQCYLSVKHESPFYKHAHFYSVDDVLELLHNAGFKEKKIYQTIFSELRILKHLTLLNPAMVKVVL